MSCRSSLTAAPVARPTAASALFQIRMGYCAGWNGLNFSVQRDSDQWTLQVQDATNSRTLYSAHRSNATAAQVAAADFAIMMTGAHRERPEVLAKELTWARYW